MPSSPLHNYFLPGLSLPITSYGAGYCCDQVQPKRRGKKEELVLKGVILLTLLAALTTFTHANSNVNQQYIESMTQGGNHGLKRTAQTMFKTGETNTEVLDVAAEILLQRYPSAANQDIDTLAWVAKALGSSRNPRYYSTLKEVADSNAHGKLRKHAAKALTYVGNPAGDQYIKGTLDLATLQYSGNSNATQTGAPGAAGQAYSSGNPSLQAIRSIAVGDAVAHEYFERGGRFERVVLVGTEPMSTYGAAKLVRENNVDAFAMLDAMGPSYRPFSFKVTLAKARLRIVTGDETVIYDKTTTQNSNVGRLFGSDSQLSNQDIIRMLAEAVAADLERAMGSAQRTAAQPTYSNNGYNQDAVKRAQQQLYLGGYSPGVADGLFGKKTAVALQQFQTDQGLNPTGRLNEDTIALLDKLYGGVPATSPAKAGVSVDSAESEFSGLSGRTERAQTNRESTSNVASTSGSTAKIISGPAEVYSRPSPFGDVLTVLPNGTRVNIITTSGEWVEIKTGSKTGFLYRDLTNLAN